MGRPTGITILGGLVVLAAIVLFLVSIASFIVALAFLFPLPEQGRTFFWNGLLFLAIAIVLGISGTGLLRMRAWAWGLAVLASLLTLVYVGYNAFIVTGGAPDFAVILTIAVVGVVFVYLLSVFRAFRRPTPSM
jgi:hypothetical protein